MSQVEDNATTQTHAKLVMRAQTRDSDAFTALYALYAPGVREYLLWLVSNEEDACDLTQKTFLKAWQSLPGLRDVTRFRSWLYRIARNLAYDQGRQKRSITWLSLEQLEELPEFTFWLDYEYRTEQAELIRLTLTELPPKYRDCLLLRLEGGFSAREIAEVVGLDEDSVNTYVSNARRRFCQVYRSLVDE